MALICFGVSDQGEVYLNPKFVITVAEYTTTRAVITMSDGRQYVVNDNRDTAADKVKVALLNEEGP